MKKYLVIALMLLLLTACSATDETVTLPTPTLTVDETVTLPMPTSTADETVIWPTPTLEPTPILVREMDYVSGESLQESGTYLFIEMWTNISGTSACEEEDSLLIDEPSYGYELTSDRLISLLDGYIDRGADPKTLIGIIGEGESLSNVGWGASSSLDTIDRLPYKISSITLHSIMEDGSIIIQVEEETFQLEPGQSWIHREYWGEEWYRGEENIPANCTVWKTKKLTNFGLLTKEQFSFSLGESLSLITPLLSDCENYYPFNEPSAVKIIEVSSNNEVWTSTTREVASFDHVTEQWKIFSSADGIIEGPFSDMIIMETGEVVVASRNGLSFYDGSEWRLESVENRPVEQYGFARIAPDGSWWFGTLNGIYHWDWENDLLRHYSEENGLFKNRSQDILFTPDGTVWATHGDAASYLPPDKKVWLVYPQSNQEQEEQTGFDNAYVAHDGKIWFNGQRYFDPAEDAWVEAECCMKGSHGRDFLIDNLGNLWIKHGWADLMYIPNPLKKSNYYEDFFRPDFDTIGDVTSMAFGSNRTMWLGSEDGVLTRCLINRPVD